MQTVVTFRSEWLPLCALPVPPMLEQALGYHGAGRYVAFWWDLSSDALCYSDGWRTQRGAEWYGWLLYSRHPLVAPHLLPLTFGGSGEQPRHALLLDRWERTVSAGRQPQVLAFLDRQLPEQLSGFSADAPTRQTPADEPNKRWQSLIDWLNALGNTAEEAPSIATLSAF